MGRNMTIELKTFKLKTTVDWQEMEKILEDIQERNRATIKRHEKQADENIQFLVKRSKQLEKEIPISVLFIAGSVPPIMVGGDFVQKHKEWFVDEEWF